MASDYNTVHQVAQIHLRALCQFIDCTHLRETCVCVHYNASMCSHYIIHDDVLQVSRMMCLDVHISHHDHLDDMYMSMMNLDENLVHNLVDDT